MNEYLSLWTTKNERFDANNEAKAKMIQERKALLEINEIKML